nr:immunoglobulin light chain junction region [Macaca mulatta]
DYYCCSYTARSTFLF